MHPAYLALILCMISECPVMDIHYWNRPKAWSFKILNLLIQPGKDWNDKKICYTWLGSFLLNHYLFCQEQKHIFKPKHVPRKWIEVYEKGQSLYGSFFTKGVGNDIKRPAGSCDSSFLLNGKVILSACISWKNICMSYIHVQYTVSPDVICSFHTLTLSCNIFLKCVSKICQNCSFAVNVPFVLAGWEDRVTW